MEITADAMILTAAMQNINSCCHAVSYEDENSVLHIRLLGTDWQVIYVPFIFQNKQVIIKEQWL